MTLTSPNIPAPTTHLNIGNPYPSTNAKPEEQHAARLVSEVDKRLRQRTASDKTRIAFYFDLGRQLQQAEKLLGNYRFQMAFERWRWEKIIRFSWTTAARYMLVARHAETITAAGITNLMAAERFVRQRVMAAWRMEQGLREPASALLLTVNEHECRLFAEIIRLPDDERNSYLKRLAAKLYRVLQQ